jgi:hypothetical protein
MRGTRVPVCGRAVWHFRGFDEDPALMWLLSSLFDETSSTLIVKLTESLAYVVVEHVARGHLLVETNLGESEADRRVWN